MKLRRMCGCAAPYWLIVAAYVLSVGFYALYGAHNINADDASEMILAAQLNDEGVFLSENWLYSTELRVISPVPLYQLGLKLFSTWHGARTFAVAVVLAGVIAAALFVMHQLGLKRSAPWLAFILSLPFSGMYAYIVLYGCYYAVHLMLAFLMLGLVCRYGRTGMAHGKASCVLLAAMGFVGGLGGVRMMTMIIAPLAAASFALAVCELKNAERCAQAAHEPGVRMCAASGVTLAAAVAGFALNMGVLRQRYSYHSYVDMRLGQFELEDFWHQFSGIVRDMGYRAYVPFFSMEGVSSWVTLGICALMLFALIRMVIRWRDVRAELRLLILTAVLAVALGMALNVLLNQILTRYFLVGTVLLMIVLFAWIETEPCRNGALRTWGIGLLAACFAFQAQCVLRYDYTLGQVNYEMAAQWLLERGYTQGYATFWNANTLTEASDGQIEMWVLEDGRRGEWMNLSLHDILQSKDHIDRDPEGKVFLLVNETEANVDAPLLDPDHLIGDMVAWSYDIYGYESVEEMRELIAQGEKR